MSFSRVFIVVMLWVGWVLVGCDKLSTNESSDRPSHQQSKKAETPQAHSSTATVFPRVPVHEVQAQLMSNDIVVPGDIRPKINTPLSFQVGGRLLNRTVKVGQIVRKGQLIAAIDTSDLQQAVNMAKAQVATAQTQWRINQKELARFEPLLRKGFISQAEFDRRKASLDAAKSMLEQATAGYEVQKNQLQYARLYSPVDGVVSQVGAEPGQLVAPGMPIVVLSSQNQLRVHFQVAEDQLKHIRVGSKVTVKLAGNPATALSAVVDEVAPVADMLSRTFPVRAAFQRQPTFARIGMTASVTIPLVATAKSLAVWVPASAIFQDNTGKDAVWVVDRQNNTIRKQNVQVGEFDNDRREILQGIQPGQWIVHAGVFELKNGQRIEIANTRSYPS